MPVCLQMIQFVCQFPRQTESADKAVHGALLYYQVLGINDLQHQFTLRLVQPLNELPVAGFNFLFGFHHRQQSGRTEISETM